MRRMENHGIGIRALLMLVCFAAVGGILVGCSVGPQTMRGSVVMAFDREAHICKGSEDGLQVGDRVAIYRTKQVSSAVGPVVPDQSGGYSPRLRYENIKVGTARVTEILSRHYASIEIIEGEVVTNDIVEKTRLP